MESSCISDNYLAENGLSCILGVVIFGLRAWDGFGLILQAPGYGQSPMINKQNEQFTEWDIEVAKRIACAVTSYQAGLEYEALWKDFANQSDDVGTFWLSIAKRIREHLPAKPK